MATLFFLKHLIVGFTYSFRTMAIMVGSVAGRVGTGTVAESLHPDPQDGGRERGWAWLGLLKL